ncbi:class I SAM-dependent methyltransferase [Fulvivirga lutimaris]|uniref:class I SAM-dependent methyltransferase n=1 Tax=Fulvivirga lutimaris TaxID=1819566 RepID=UPI0012BC46AB|nr:class I SAM-dependent methyltransferase [Fulvivirga lutimaris]MTI38964.1 class I SAM-dependent methyltransferase [Fulvivirga lutimaris]
MNNKYKLNFIRGPINALFFRTLDNYMHSLFGASKKALFSDHPDTLVEIGPGTGANMRYLRRGTKLIAIEPNVHMHASLIKSAKKHNIHLEIISDVGEDINLPESAYQMVICTLVLCTVSNPEKCISEIKRILKPSGKFIFIEHVTAKDSRILAALQKAIHKPWHWFFEGCNLSRDTKSILEASGFSKVGIEEYNLKSPFIPIMPQIKGYATK